MLNENTRFQLPPTGQILLPFDATSAITSLPVYCANAGQEEILANLVAFLEDGDYSYQFISRACPTTQQQGGSNTILGFQSFEDQISVPTGSFLTMIGGISSQGATNGGFRVRFYDAGAQATISDGWVNANTIVGRFKQLPQTGTGMVTSVNADEGLFILPSPLAITSPGQLNVEITNLSPNMAIIDMAFYFATPVGYFNQVIPAWAGNAVNK